MSTLFDDILAENIEKIGSRISGACAWFYARYLMEDSEDQMLFRANRLLIPRKYPTVEPQGPHEAEILESKQYSRKKALLAAQLYDIAEEYGGRFRMEGTEAPETVTEGLSNCIDFFIKNTAQELSRKIQQGFVKGSPMDQLTSALTQCFKEKAEKFHARVKDYYTQAAWYGVLQSYDKGQRFVFQVDKQDGTCERCSARAGVVYTAEEIIGNDLLPPLHPNCRCTILTYEQARGVEPEGGLGQAEGQMKTGAGNVTLDNVLDPLVRLPEDAADMVHAYQLTQLERLQNGDYLDWATAGIVSGVWDGLETRAQTMIDNPTFYNIGNWLTLGLFDTIKGALFPEEPLSLQHWMDSAGLAATVYGAYKAPEMVSSYYKGKRAFESGGVKGGAAGVLDDVDDAVKQGVKSIDDLDVHANQSSYSVPQGGGGVTSSITQNGKIIDFGHGGRHLEGTGLSVEKVNEILAAEISKIHPGTGKFYKGQVLVNSIIIEYTSYGVKDGVINIGTYYPVQK